VKRREAGQPNYEVTMSLPGSNNPNKFRKQLDSSISDKPDDAGRMVTTPDGIAFIRNGELFLQAGFIEGSTITSANVNNQLSEAVQEEIRKALRPGGLLHGR
jgi:hypothetical protein